VRHKKIQEALGILSAVKSRAVNVQDSTDFAEVVVVHILGCPFFSSINLINEVCPSIS